MLNRFRGTPLLVGAIHLVLFVSAFGAGQTSQAVVDRKIPSFSVTKADIHVALQNLAIAHQVPIGLEMISEKLAGDKKVFFDISMNGSSVRDVLTAIVEKDPRYQWKEESGVINVFPVQHQDTCLTVSLEDFVVSGVTRTEVISHIVNADVVRERTRQLAISLRNSISLPDDYQHQKRFSLDLHHITVRRILNEIVKQADGYYWVFQIYGKRYGDEDRYFMLML